MRVRGQFNACSDGSSQGVIVFLCRAPKPLGREGQGGPLHAVEQDTGQQPGVGNPSFL